MLRHIVLGTVLVVSLGAGTASAQPGGRPVPQIDRFARLADQWVQLYLRRNATPREIQLISNQLRLGASAAQAQATILGSDEYYIRCNRNLTAWSQSVVRDVLGRNPTANEVAMMQANVVRGGRVFAAQIVLESVAAPPILPPWGWF